MKKRAMLTAVVYPMAYIMLFGPATAMVLVFFADAARFLIPMVAAASVVFAVPISWLIAPRLSVALSAPRRRHMRG